MVIVTQVKYKRNFFFCFRVIIRKYLIFFKVKIQNYLMKKHNEKLSTNKHFSDSALPCTRRPGSDHAGLALRRWWTHPGNFKFLICQFLVNILSFIMFILGIGLSHSHGLFCIWQFLLFTLMFFNLCLPIDFYRLIFPEFEVFYRNKNTFSDSPSATRGPCSKFWSFFRKKSILATSDSAQTVETRLSPNWGPQFQTF